MSSVFDPRICQLGEGAFWHPTRQQFFWFDILGRRLLSQKDGTGLEWSFPEMVSACGWIDHDTLLIASETALLRFDLVQGESQPLAALEAGHTANRSNDGRADPQGGFWIGTMSRTGEQGHGAIYRYYQGQLRQLHAHLSIPNAICFSPDGQTAYFADTAQQIVWQQKLDAQGWPDGDKQVFIDLRGTDEHPDGAVTDAEGRFWNARWGGAAVVCHAPDGRELHRLPLPAAQVTCPAFGGADLATLLVTSAAEGLDGPEDGRTFQLAPGVTGRPEPQVML